MPVVEPSSFVGKSTSAIRSGAVSSDVMKTVERGLNIGGFVYDYKLLRYRELTK